MYTSLMDALAQNEVLMEENERYRQLTNTRDRRCVGFRERLPDGPPEAAQRDPDGSFQDCPGQSGSIAVVADRSGSR